MIQRSILSLGSLALACSLSAAPQVESILPVDTQAVLKVDTNCFKDHPNNPLSEIYKSKSIKDLYTALLSGSDSDVEDINSFVSDISGVIEGDVAFALSSFEVVDKDAEPNAEALMVIGYNGDDASILQALEESGSDYNQVEGYRSFPKYSFADEKDSEEASDADFDLKFILAGDYIFISTKDSVLNKAVDALLDGLDVSFQQSDAYSYMTSEWDSNDIYAYIDLKSLGETVNSLIQVSMEPEEGETPNMMVPRAEDIIKALKLGQLGDYYVNCSFTDDEVITDTSMYYDGSDGICSTIASVHGDLEYPSFIPDDALYGVLYSYDVPMLVESLEGMMQTASPMVYAMYQQYSMGYSQQLGVDLRDLLVSGLGDDMGEIYFQPADSEINPMFESVYYVRLNNPELVQSGIKAIMGAFGESEETGLSVINYNGSKIYDIVNPDPELPGHIEFSVIDNWLFFGKGGEDILTKFIDLKNNGGKTLLDVPYLSNEMKMHPNAQGYLYADVDGFMNPLLNMICWFADQEGKALDTESVMSDVSYPYYVTGYIKNNGRVLRYHSVLKKK